MTEYKIKAKGKQESIKIQEFLMNLGCYRYGGSPDPLDLPYIFIHDGTYFPSLSKVVFDNTDYEEISISFPEKPVPCERSTPKYVTEPIDYSGCHLIIAEALRGGESILCQVWDRGFEDDKVLRNVSAFVSGHYVEGDSDSQNFWDHAEPAKKPLRTKPFKELLEVLISAGYRPSPDGDWDHPENPLSFTAGMLEQASHSRDLRSGCFYSSEWLE